MSREAHVQFGERLAGRFRRPTHLDITVDSSIFREMANIEEITRSQLKKISKELKADLERSLQKIILPHLEKCITLLPNQEKFSVIFDGKENLRFYYPSVLSSAFTDNSYLRDHILIEFGVRNSIEPNEKHVITPLLSEVYFEKPLCFFKAEVDVLSVIRTFWEKATLIHVECNRKRLRESSNRFSRHWYDLAMLKNGGLDKEALDQKKILESVIKYKKAFFNAPYAYYDDCLGGKFRLIPDELDKESLRRDYESMKRSGMFSEEPMPFDEILGLLRELEAALKQS